MWFHHPATHLRSSVRDRRPSTTLREVRAVFAAALAISVLTGCAGVQSQVDLSPCTRSVEVEGEHLRRDTDLRFDHAFDLPFTQTEYVVTHADGSQTRAISTNAVPDFLRAFAGAVILGLSSAGIFYYSLEVGRGADPVATDAFWALPVGIGGVALATYFLATGWHPIEDVILPTRCLEPTTFDRFDNPAVSDEDPPEAEPLDLESPREDGMQQDAPPKPVDGAPLH